MSLTITTPTDRTIVMSRTFAAPRGLVFAAHTRAEHVRQWWGRGMLQSGMETGAEESYRALDEYLAKLA